MQRGRERFDNCSGFEFGFTTHGLGLGYCLGFVLLLHSPWLPPSQLLWKHKGASLNRNLTFAVPSTLLDITRKSSPAPSLTSSKSLLKSHQRSLPQPARAKESTLPIPGQSLSPCPALFFFMALTTT